MDINKFLPIGSVVKLISYDEEVMIMGYFCIYEGEEKVQAFDYIGCNVLEEYKDDNIIAFDKGSIDNVLFVGYKTEQIIHKLNGLDQAYKKIKSFKSEEEMDEYVDKRIMKKFNSSRISQNYVSLISKVSEEEGKTDEQSN